MSPNTPHRQSLSETYQQAKAHHQQGRFNEARALYLQVLQAAPGHPQVLHQLGVIAFQKGDMGEAVLLIQQAIGLNPSVASFHNNLGNALKRQTRLKKAAESYREAVRLKPDYAMARLNLARLQMEQGDADGAEEECRAVLQTAPQLGIAHCLLGELLAARNLPDEAISAYEKAVALQPDLSDAYMGLGHLHRQKQDAEAAIEAFRQAVRLQPEQVAGYQNLGSAYLIYNRLEEAKRCFQRAHELAPNDYGVRYNLGTALRSLGRLPEARTHLEAVVQAQPDAIGAVYELNQLRSGVCDWTTRDQDLTQLVQTTQRFLDEESEQRLPLLFLQRFNLPSKMWPDLVRQQAGVIKRAVDPLKQPSVSVKPSALPDRLKIGYVSPDFRAHAVGLLTHRMFELHDRSKFEIHAYSLTCPNHYSSDPFYQKTRQGCDAFADLSGLSVTTAADKIAADGVHILVDLAGHTTFSRPELLALRPAPVQAHYLGFLDTMGADFLPYLIADETVIPEGTRNHYSENIVYLPNTFAVASPFEIDPTPVCRADCNLPDDGPVFCCFNHVYKIDPDVFDAWSAILQAVPLMRSLPMPHSPRVFDGQLYLLLSVTGEVVKVDVATGQYEVINHVPAFVRGLAKWGDYLFVGASHLRKTHTFGDLPLAQEGATFCGVMVIHLPTGALVSQLKYVNSCEEIFDVQILPGLRRPGIMGTHGEIHRRALSLKETTFWAAEEDEEARLTSKWQAQRPADPQNNA